VIEYKMIFNINDELHKFIVKISIKYLS